MFDDLFLDHFSNFQDPLAAAQSFVDDAIDEADYIWEMIDDRFKIFRLWTPPVSYLNEVH